jgi:hypothetical protein
MSREKGERGGVMNKILVVDDEKSMRILYEDELVTSPHRSGRRAVTHRAEGYR